MSIVQKSSEKYIQPCLSLREEGMRTEPTFDLRAYLSEKKTIVDRALEACLPEPEGLTADLRGD